jgi:hypothetical protein
MMMSGAEIPLGFGWKVVDVFPDQGALLSSILAVMKKTGILDCSTTSSS